MAYAWSTIYAGGEVEQRARSTGAPFNVVVKRNIIPAGEEVSQKDLDLTDEEWEVLVEGGSVRDYPFPEGTDEYTSPSAAFMQQVLDPEGNVDASKIMEMGLSHVPILANPEEEEEGKPSPTATRAKADTPKGA